MAWSPRNRGLCEALILHEDSMCGGCGHPIGTAWDPDSDGWWTAHETTCQACAAVDNHNSGQKEHPPGGRVRAVLDVTGWRASQEQRNATRPTPTD